MAVSDCPAYATKTVATAARCNRSRAEENPSRPTVQTVQTVESMRDDPADASPTESEIETRREAELPFGELGPPFEDEVYNQWPDMEKQPLLQGRVVLKTGKAPETPPPRKRVFRISELLNVEEKDDSKQNQSSSEGSSAICSTLWSGPSSSGVFHTTFPSKASAVGEHGGSREQSNRYHNKTSKEFCGHVTNKLSKIPKAELRRNEDAPSKFANLDRESSSKLTAAQALTSCPPRVVHG